MNNMNLGQEPTGTPRKSSHSVSKLWQDVGGFHRVVPYSTANSLNVLKNPGTWLMLFFGFVVLPFNQSVPSNGDLLIFGMGYFSLVWAAYFYVFVAKRRSSLWLGLAIAVFTMVAGIPFGRLLKSTILSPFYRMNSSPADIVRLIGTLGSHGLAEESLKALPLVLLLFAPKLIKRPIDGVFYGALSGLGFAAWEGYKFVLNSDSGGILMNTLVRTTAVPFLHAIWSAISGYFVALAKGSQRRVLLCALGLGTAAILHGCFDFLSNTPRLVMAVIAYLLFADYVDRGHQMAQEMEKVDAIPLAPQLAPAEASQAAAR